RRDLLVARLRSRRRVDRRPRRAVIALAATAVLAVGLITVGAQVVFALIGANLGPLPPTRPLNADSIVTDAAGNVIAELHPAGETGPRVSLDQVAPLMQRAIVDVEDRSFWSEGPIDLGRMVASAWHDLR